MFYERLIVYLDYLMNRDKCGNAGFVKLEVRDTICKMNINIKGLRETDSFPIKVYLIGKEKEQMLCSMELQRGSGFKQLLQLDAKNLGQTGIAYYDLQAIRITISPDRELYAKVRDKKILTVSEKRTEDAMGQASPEAEKAVWKEPVTEPMNYVMESAEEAITSEEYVMESQSCARPQGNVVELESDMLKPQDYGMETKEFELENDRGTIESKECRLGWEESAIASEEMVHKAKDVVKENNECVRAKKTVLLHDNKWRQLWEIYPHIAPFQDEREFLSVSPGDFVILPEKYFRMVNNSFLLHGYYNYKHLILKRMEWRGATRYYIGVPGNFYDREKQVALMFGFESFESLKEPAREGDYGYYLMRIEL